MALFGLVAFLYAMMGVLDFVRGQVLTRVAARFQDDLDQRVFSASLRGMTNPATRQLAQTGQQDLESIQRLIGSPLTNAVFDMPWVPVFLFGIFLFHSALGVLAISGGAILVGIALMNQMTTRAANANAQKASGAAHRMSEQLRTESEMVRSLGMMGSAFQRWNALRSRALAESVTASSNAGRFSAAAKALRLFLQSAMLALGAFLVLRNEMTAGAMIAGSILLGRSLAPIEAAIGQWAFLQRARQGWQNLVSLLSVVPPLPSRMPLPRPDAELQVRNLTIIPPGEPMAALKMVNFKLTSGKALGVIGPSGSGKSTLAKALTGVWPASGGSIRLGGATLDQYDPDVLGSYIGYLPQRVELFDGSIAENIAMLKSDADPEQIVKAAQMADAHQMILEFPLGYDTPVTSAGGRLSGGQIQRIGLARAVFGDPVILVLDEPNSNLDNTGSTALNNAVRTMKQQGKAVLIMAHRPAAIQECEDLLVLDQGTQRDYGPRDEVLGRTVTNAKTLQTNPGSGGVT